MQQSSSADSRIAEISKIAATKGNNACLRKHLEEVLEGEAFSGSQRSGQFLRHIVEQAIAGNFESLKERVLGIEIFGRSPSYDTGEDAIVRVTASDVRKRLQQHYDRYGETSKFRLGLPAGSYIPEITRSHNGAVRHFAAPDSASSPFDAEDADRDDTATARQFPLAAAPGSKLGGGILSGRQKRSWALLAATIAALNLLVWAIFWIHSSLAQAAVGRMLPWSTMLRTAHSIRLIASDPNIAEIQGFTGGQISASDYANHRYIPDPSKLTPEQLNFCRVILRGDKSSVVDTAIAINIAELAQSRSKRIDLRPSRSVELSELKTDDNFILLGSPRTNPWSGLFSDKLDFQFAFDQNTRTENIRNVHPRSGEQTLYVPTAPGWATGVSYAIIAFLQNSDQDGHVLLLAGANGEGTEAAGKLALDPLRLSTVLHQCGISPSSRPQHFELLLKLNMMAGTPSNTSIVACHWLPTAPTEKP